MSQATKNYFIAILSGTAAGWVVHTVGMLVRFSMTVNEVQHAYYYDDAIVNVYATVMIVLVMVLVLALLSWKER